MKNKIIIFGIIILIISFVYVIDDYVNLKNYQNTNKNIQVNKIFSIKEVEVEEDIPKNIIQTYKNKESVPSFVFDNIKSKNPDWNYHFYDDNECKKFLLTHFGQDFVNKFNEFKLGAHKSDLFRLCWLYVHGGVYLDIDSQLYVSLDEIIKDLNTNFTILRNKIRKNSYQNFLSSLFNIRQDTLINSFIIVNKGNKLLKELINAVMNIRQRDLDKNGYASILFLMQKVVGKNFNYELEERYSLLKGSEMYTKKGKLIGITKYKNFKNHDFV